MISVMFFLFAALWREHNKKLHHLRSIQRTLVAAIRLVPTNRQLGASGTRLPIARAGYLTQMQPWRECNSLESGVESSSNALF
jgi:hypothetical protein